jgi:plastocyanin
MTLRIARSLSPFAMLLAAGLVAALAGCSRQASAASGAPAPVDTAPAPDTSMASQAGTASDSDVSAGAQADSTVAAATATAERADSDDAPPATAADSQWVTWDPATKTVTFLLVAGPFDFNGPYANGGATLTVPSGSTTVINFEQNDGTPHSVEVASGTGPVPNSGGDPAIPRAYSNKVVEGLPQGAKDVIRFTAPDSGTFRLICGVPGHALSGMWIWYKVDPAAKAPSFGPTPK